MTTPRPIARVHRSHRRTWDAGPDCAKCGYKAINVRHTLDPNSAPEGPEYYADMLDELHPFEPVVTP